LDFYVKSNEYFENKKMKITTNENLEQYVKKKLENIEFNHKKINLFDFPRDHMTTFSMQTEFPSTFKSDYHPKLRSKSSSTGSRVQYNFNIPVFCFDGKNFSIESGCTCSLLLCVQDYVFCGNVGDSDCYLMDSDKNMFPLFEKHDNSSDKEVERLEGLCVVDKSYFCIKFKKVFDEQFMEMPEDADSVPIKKKKLQPSRNLGHPIVRHSGITNKPCIKYINSEPDDVIIIGSDGLWNYVDAQKIKSVLMRKPIPDSIKNGQEKANYIAHLIYQEYMFVWKVKSKMFDNMTFAVVFCSKY